MGRSSGICFGSISTNHAELRERAGGGRQGRAGARGVIVHLRHQRVDGRVRCAALPKVNAAARAGGPAGRTTTIVYLIYNTAFKFFQMGYASALAYVLFGMVFIFTFLQMRYYTQRIQY